VFTVPPMLPRDESSHISYALRVAHGHLPKLDEPNVRGVIPHMQTKLPIFTANHPPLLYAIVAVPLEIGVRAHRPILGLRAARATSFLFAVATVIGAAILAGLVLPGRESVPVVAAAVVALTPIVPHETALVYNDAIGMAASTWLLIAGMLIFRRGPTRRLVLLLLAMSAFAALARSSSLFALPSAIALAGFGTRRWRPALLLGAASVSVVALAGGWFYLRNKHLYGSYLGNGYLKRPNGQAIVKRPYLDALVDVRVERIMVDRLWNGWVLLSRLPKWPEWVGGVVQLTAVVGVAEAARRALRRGARPGRETVIIWSCLGLFSLIVLASVVGFLSIGGNAHARYLFPLLPVFGILIGIGYAQLPWVLTPGAICWTAIANLVLWHRWVITNGGVASNTPGIAEIQALRGAGLRGAPVLLAIAAIVFAAGIALAARSVWGRYPAGTAESRATSAA
jgi:4-amino-4-deoxy-L-arabinose transferase-like glycosyltransferase